MKIRLEEYRLRKRRKTALDLTRKSRRISYFQIKYIEA